MCTVTFIPIQADEFILTSNRDESPLRSPLELRAEAGLLFPQDPKAGGTWICASEQGRLICLLNGAFVKHRHEPPYRKSRGLVVLEAFDYEQPEDFFEHYPLEGIEPFTMVFYDKNRLWDFRWDGQQRHLKSLSPKAPHIWSSATLYDDKIRSWRESWFADWQAKHPQPQLEDILAFHRGAGIGDSENDLVMSRHEGKVCTVSITAVEYKGNAFYFKYNDLIHDQQHHARLNTPQGE